MQRGLIASGLLALLTGLAANAPASAQQVQAPYFTGYQLNNFFYYPYHYFPHNYWPAYGPQWPEPPGAPYLRPPAYQAYPAFREPNWRYELWTPQKYYRGFHFWLDQF